DRRPQPPAARAPRRARRDRPPDRRRHVAQAVHRRDQRAGRRGPRPGDDRVERHRPRQRRRDLPRPRRGGGLPSPATGSCYVPRPVDRRDDDIEPDEDAVEEDPMAEADDEDDDVPDTPVSIEISGLSLYTHHGVTAAEREIGQRLVLDITLDMLRNDAT